MRPPASVRAGAPCAGRPEAATAAAPGPAAPRSARRAAGRPGGTGPGSASRDGSAAAGDAPAVQEQFVGQVSRQALAATWAAVSATDHSPVAAALGSPSRTSAPKPAPMSVTAARAADQRAGVILLCALTPDPGMVPLSQVRRGARFSGLAPFPDDASGLRRALPRRGSGHSAPISCVRVGRGTARPRSVSSRDGGSRRHAPRPSASRRRLDSCAKVTAVKPLPRARGEEIPQAGE